MKHIQILVLLLIFSSHCINAQENVRVLPLNSADKNAKWSFHAIDSTQAIAAQVPGNVYTDLLANKRIDDPYFGDNEQKLRWIDTTVWLYTCRFEVDSNLLKKKNRDLVFEGLDTYCELYLNGQFIRICDNMFRKYTVNVNNSLVLGENVLEIKFYPAATIAKHRKELFEKTNKYALPEGERVFIRKAQYQFGWDFAPRMLGVGVWKSIYLRAWDDLLIENLYVETVGIDTVAHMSLHYTAVLDTENMNRSTWLFIRRLGTNDMLALKKRYLFNHKKGTSDSCLSFEISNPKLWWPNEQGDQNIYELIWVDSKNEHILGNLGQVNFGIRQVELIKQLDSDSLGTSFYFKVNGRPIFMKGANYVPMDLFPSRVTYEDRKKLLQAAKEAHMNMIRIWGGGIYESDDFYSLCDSLGIMVWQDFMYACAMYPSMPKTNSYSPLMANKIPDEEKEWEDNFYRIQQHPCLALWCGNNEIEEGWWNWGWQRSLNYSKSDSSAVWHSYQARFHEAIPAFLNKHHSMVQYVSSSPQIGWGHPESLTQGDSHYWGVWWGMEPYETYAKKVPRFASEFGMQSWPCYASMKKVLPDSALNVNASLFTQHQKHPTGQANLDGYLKMYQHSYNSFKDYLMETQLLQADAMKTALEAQRKASPRCMGSLMWQLNDCWPGASWSLIDYYGEKKKAYYRAQETFVKNYQTPLR